MVERRRKFIFTGANNHEAFIQLSKIHQIILVYVLRLTQKHL